MSDKSKVTVFVRLKTEVLDPQGDAVRRALGSLGFDGVKSVRIGKLVEIELTGAADGDTVKKKVAEMADAILVNPVIEDFEIV